MVAVGGSATRLWSPNSGATELVEASAPLLLEVPGRAVRWVRRSAESCRERGRRGGEGKEEQRIILKTHNFMSMNNEV